MCNCGGSFYTKFPSDSKSSLCQSQWDQKSAGIPSRICSVNQQCQRKRKYQQVTKLRFWHYVEVRPPSLKTFENEIKIVTSLQGHLVAVPYILGFG